MERSRPLHVVHEHRRRVGAAVGQEDRRAGHPRDDRLFELRPLLFEGAMLAGILGHHRRAAVAPDQHRRDQRRPDQHRHIAAVEELEHVRQQEGDIDAQEEGEGAQRRPAAPAPGVADDEVVEDRRHHHRTGDGQAVGRGELHRLTKREHERQAADPEEHVDLGDVDLPLVVVGGVADRHAGQEAQQHRLPRQREGPGDECLGGDDGGKAGEDHQRVSRRTGGHHGIERVGRRRRIPQQERPLAEIGEHQRRQHEPQPGPADGLQAEVPHVGIERLAAGHHEHHGAEDEQTVQAVPEEELDGIPGVDRGEHGGLADELVHPQGGQREEPDKHDRSEQPAHDSRARPLDGKQREQDHTGDRHHPILEGRAGHRQAFHGAEHRDGRRDHAVAVEQRGAHHGQERHARHAADAAGPGAIAFGHECQQRQDAPFAVVVGLHHEHHVFDGDHDDQRPEHQ